MDHEQLDHVKTIGDIAAGAVALGTIVKWLPAVAAILTIIWTALRIFEWVKDRKWKRVS